jgi:hypothetical protein
MEIRKIKKTVMPKIAIPDLLTAKALKLLMGVLVVLSGIGYVAHVSDNSIDKTSDFTVDANTNVKNVDVAIHEIQNNKNTIRYSISCDNAKEDINGYLLSALRDIDPEHKELNTKYKAFLFEALSISNLYKNNKNADPDFTEYNKLYAELHGN